MAGLGPTGSFDNGDGTFTFNLPDGSTIRAAGPVAAQKHAELNMPPTPGGATLNVPGLGLDASGNLAPGVMVPPSPAAAPPQAPPDQQTSAIVADLQAQGLAPQTIKAPEKGGAHGGGRVAKSDLVGAGAAASENGRIPTVVTGAGPVGGRVIPGSLQLAGKSTAQTEIPEEAQKGMQAATGLKLQATDEQTAADTEAAQQIAAAKNEALGGVQWQDQLAQAQEAKRQAYLADRQAKIDQFTRKLQDMPDVHAPSFGIGGAIALALSSAGTTLARGGTNVAMEVLNKRIDTSIDAQKTNINKAKGAAEGELSAYKTALETYGSQRQAELALRNNYLNQAAQRIDAIVADNQSPILQAKATAMKAAIMDEKAKNDANIGKIETHNSYVMTKPQVVGGAAPVYGHADIKKDEVVKGPDGKQYEFGAGTTAAKAAERMAAINQGDKDAGELLSITSNPANLIDQDKRAAAQAIVARILKTDQAAEGGKTSFRSKEAMDMAERAIGGDPNALLNFGRSAGIKEFRAGLHQEANGLIQQYALSEVEPYQEQNARTGEETLRFRRRRFGPKAGPDTSGTEVGE